MAIQQHAAQIETLADKYTRRFHDTLGLPTEHDCRLRCLLELVIAEAVFLGRWEELPDASLPEPCTHQLTLGLPTGHA